MKIYTVHVNKNSASPLQSAVFVKEGFSIWAAIFQFFWALYNKMWLCGAVLFVVYVGFAVMKKYAIINAGATTILQIGFLVFIGFSANDWYRQYLSKKGFVLLEIISGNSLLEVKKKFLNLHLTDPTLSPPSNEEGIKAS